MTAARHAQFQRLLDEHRRILFKVSHAYGRSAADREDLAQEIVVQLWRSFPAYDERLRFSTWMYRVALNVAISAARRESTRTRHVLSNEERVLEATTDDADEAAGGALAELRARIDALDPLHRALVLLYVDGHSYQEIAAIAGISETSVATKLHRIKAAWRREVAAPDMPTSNEASAATATGGTAATSSTAAAPAATTRTRRS